MVLESPSVAMRYVPVGLSAGSSASIRWPVPLVRIRTGQSGQNISIERSTWERRWMTVATSSRST